jgi:hypothetical protein
MRFLGCVSGTQRPALKLVPYNEIELSAQKDWRRLIYKGRTGW